MLSCRSCSGKTVLKEIRMGKKGIVFLQRRAQRAGAQTCLQRLLVSFFTHPSYYPILVCAEKGWLTNKAEANAITTLQFPFASPRSLVSRLGGFRFFSHKLFLQLRKKYSDIAIIHANDYQEVPLAIALGKKFGVKTAVFLRSSGMKKNDFFKYQCHHCDFIISIDQSFIKEIKPWVNHKSIYFIPDGLLAEEFFPIKKTHQFPLNLVVIGTSARNKGWKDVYFALQKLPKAELANIQRIDFIAANKNDRISDYIPSHLGLKGELFLRTESFIEFIQKYDLVINPSRRETFGMAAIETIAAGIPLLSTPVGILPSVFDDKRLLFEVNNPTSLSNALQIVMQQWDTIVFDSIQKMVKHHLLIDNAIEKLAKLYEK